MTPIPTASLLFSVIIPTYHRNDRLTQCLDCLAPTVQTLPAEHYEVIVSDDGSITTAQALIAERYPWVRWVAGPGRGPAANRNNGAAHARGEWLVFTDDDCLPDAQWLAAYREAIAPNVEVYEGKTTCHAGLKSPLEHAPINLCGGYLWSCNLMIKTSLFNDMQGFDINFLHPHMEDVEFRDRLQERNYTFRFVENAAIDHPSKKILNGEQLGVLHECDVYYWHKKKQTLSSKTLILQILNARLRRILYHPLSVDSFKALVVLFFELKFTLKNLDKWHQKYSA